MCMDGRCGHFDTPRTERDRQIQAAAKARMQSGSPASPSPVDIDFDNLIALLRLFAAGRTRRII